MNNCLIAVPSNNPGGMDAELAGHFGHCDMFTLVNIEEGKVSEVKILPSIPHEQGGCMAPVQYLAQNGVKTLIAGGMGFRPLMGFNQVGIDVYFGGDAQTVGQAVTGLHEKLSQDRSGLAASNDGKRWFHEFIHFS